MKRFFPLMILYFIATGIARHGYGQIRTVSGNQISPATMDQFLKMQMDSLRLPGLSIAVINDGRVVYYRTLRLANIDSQKTVDVQKQGRHLREGITVTTNSASK